VEPDAAHHPLGLVWAECFKERVLEVCIEVVEDHMEVFGMAVARQTWNSFNVTSKVGLLSVTGHGRCAESSCRFNSKKDMAHAVPFVFIVPSSRFARFHCHPAPRVFQKLF